MKKTETLIYLLCILLLWYGAALSASQTLLSISGTVKQPLNLTMDDFRRFDSVSVRLNEVTTDRTFHGAFSYDGVPLRILLNLAVVDKGETDFSKPVDLAIVVKNKEGKQTVLSWGEIFYRNPAEVIIAIIAAPIMPHHECSGCHTPEVFKKWFDPLKRNVGLPKLVVANDFYTDRSLEDITSIEAIDLHPKLSSQKMQDLFPPAFSVTGAVKETLNIADGGAGKESFADARAIVVTDAERDTRKTVDIRFARRLKPGTSFVEVIIMGKEGLKGKIRQMFEFKVAGRAS